MGKDIDRNITRQLWERLKKTFTRNDVIPVENGGTGANNDVDAFRHLISNGTTIRGINNTYKNPKLDKIISGTLYLNKKSIFIDLYGTANILEDDTYFTLIALNNIPELKGIKTDFIYGVFNSHIYIDDGSLTITASKETGATVISGIHSKGFILY